MSHHSRPKRRLFGWLPRPVLAIVAAVTVAVGIGAAATPAFAEGSGSINGHLSDDGTPVSAALVTLFDSNFNFVNQVGTGALGEFTFSAVPAGEYKVLFQIDNLFQWSSGKSTFNEADIVIVLADQVTTVDEQLRPRGTIAGHLTDAGEPVAGASVTLYDTNFNFVNFVTTDTLGGFAFATWAGDYKIEFQYGFLTQWSAQKRSFADADIVTIAPDQVTTVEEELLPPGSIAGHLTDGGEPVAGASVTLYNTNFNFVASTFTDDAGGFTFGSVLAGDYKIAFWTDGVAQWHPQKASFDQADIITVASGQVTTVEEEFLPRGSIAGHLTDAGAPVAFASVLLYDTGFTFVSSTFTDNDGGFTFGGVLPGEYKVQFQTDTVSGTGTQWYAQKSSFDAADVVTVAGGQVATVEEELLPAGSITGHLTDAGAPVADAVVTLYDTGFNFVASTFTDNSGSFTFGSVVPGQYKLQFQTGTRTQWHSQKTSFDSADVITVAGGEVTTVEEQLPPSGSITGHLTDAGAPVVGAFVTLYDTDFRPIAFRFTDNSGGFTFGSLVPGQYKLQFQAATLTQWHSQKLSFSQADIVTVVAGQVATVDEVVIPRASVTGHLTDAGAPVAGASVELYDLNQRFITATVTGDSGQFALDNVPEGDYKIRFAIQSYSQWHTQKRSFFDADVVTLVAGEVTTVEEAIVPSGSISGRVVRADGTAAAFVPVRASGVGPNSGSGFTTTDGSGRYTISHLLPGEYHVEFRADAASPPQYANNATRPRDAELITVTSGETTTLDQQLLPVGTITGVLTTASGAPVSFAFITAQQAGTSEPTGSGQTNAQGRYTLKVFAGAHTLAFRTQLGTQWASGRSSAAQADPISVPGGGTTTHNETLAPVGSASITAVDAATGAALSSFCVSPSTSFGSVCTDTGTVTYDALPGPHRVSFFKDGYVSDGAVVEITSGTTSPIVLRVMPAATLTTTAIDKVTGAPVVNACLELVPVTGASSLGRSFGPCSDAAGTITLPFVRPGSYKAFVWARDGVHGHQWVGGDGHGTGQFEKAKTITVTAGQAVALPPIRMDEAGGAIVGTVTDEVTGAPVTRGSVSLSSFNSGFGGQGGMFSIDEQGRYSVSGLGPYQWEFLFAASPYAYEWSGDAATRGRANTVKVKKDEVVVYDTTVGPGTTVSGSITDQGGTLANSGRITFLNADTGDEIAVDDIFDNGAGQYVAQVKGPQQVKVSYFAFIGAQSYVGLVGGTTFAEATTFTIPDSGLLTLDITVTQIQV